MLPACGQGALGIECRKEDTALKEILAPLVDPITSLCVQTERLVNAKLGGNCHVPLAVYCRPLDNDRQIVLQAKVCSEDGEEVIEAKVQVRIEEHQDAAAQCVRELLNQGAERLLKTGEA